MVFVVAKKDMAKPYWPRLIKENKKSQYIQCDWDKWVDEDEEQEAGNKGLGSFDQTNMNNFNDSDDDEQIPAQDGGLEDWDKEEIESKPETPEQVPI